MRLSQHFTLEEMLESNTARKHGHTIIVTDEAIANLRVLCESVLEPLRAEVGPIIITSGFRDAITNKLVGGVANSDHCTGRAVDCRPARCSYIEAGRFVEDSLDFDQLIYYHDEARLHVGYRAGANRKQVIHKGKP